MFNRAWLAGGIPRTACVAAYEPVCAVSLADSYINRANPGTLDATAPVAAPTWAESTGWTFNGSSQYLRSDYKAGAGASVLIRYSGATDSASQRVVCGWEDGTGNLFIEPSHNDRVWYGHWGALNVSPGLLSGVLGVVGQYGYRDGAINTPLLASTASPAPPYIAIGAHYKYGNITLYCPCNVQAMYCYNVPLTPTQVRAVTDAMNMLPMRPQLPRFRSWLTGGAVTQFRKAFGLRTGSRGVPE